MEIPTDQLLALRHAAEAARAINYSPYSGFVVLAAAQMAGGEIGGGSNVENVNFSLTKHAEEVAILQALQLASSPPQAGSLAVVYVAGAMPCGSCRQFALEFGGSDALWVVDLVEQDVLRNQSLLDLPTGAETVMTFGAALPSAFATATPGIRRAPQHESHASLR